VLLVSTTLALVVVVLFAPGRVELALRIYVLVLAAVGIELARASLYGVFPPTLRLRTDRSDAPPAPPAGLTRLEHVVSLGIAGAFDLHHRLVPRLRSLADGLLARRRRISLADEASARAVLGDETWELVRSDRPPPTDRLARGIPLPELERAVASLERI
jgi:hypothetical protein